MLEKFSGELYDTLERSCGDCRTGPIALSGGLDSTIIAHLLKDKKPRAVTVIAKDFVSTDLTYCQMAAKETGLPLVIHSVKTAEILDAVGETIKILRNFNDIEIRNNVVMYLAIKWAKENGEDVVVTGDGADELFAGYSFLVNKPEKELEGEIKRVCSVMHFPTQKIGEALGVTVESPFLDERVIRIAEKIPAVLKVKTDKDGKRCGKWILRKTFERDIPPQIAWRKKSPMQDGAGTVGLTGMFESVIGEEQYVEKKLTVEKNDGVIIKSRESMYYYEIFKRMFGVPKAATSETEQCPYCRYDVGKSRFCRMCGAFPI